MNTSAPIVRSFIAMSLVTAVLVINPSHASAKEQRTLYPVAIFSFQERGRDAAELGGQVTDLLFTNLAAEPSIYLVERDDLKKILDEQELNISGLVNPATANQVGHLTGAKILVTGSVLQVRETLYVIAKVIGTETSRVLGASVKGGVDDDLAGLVKPLAKDVIELISSRGDDLVAKPVSRDDRLAALKKQVKGDRLPSVSIVINERHVGQPTIDPAAETELALFCNKLGFDVLDSEHGKGKADVLLRGEGFSEFASRHGNLISVKARLEVKVVDRKSGRVFAVDRQVAVAVDLTEQLAGKTALQDAAARLSTRLLPKLAERFNAKR